MKVLPLAWCCLLVAATSWSTVLGQTTDATTATTATTAGTNGTSDDADTTVTTGSGGDSGDVSTTAPSGDGSGGGGNGAAANSTATNTTPTTRLHVSMRLTDQEFSADLEDQQSQAYTTLAAEVSLAIRDSMARHLAIDADKITVTILGFSNGSVIVNSTVTVQDDVTTDTVTSAVMNLATDPAFNYTVAADDIATQEVPVDTTADGGAGTTSNTAGTGATDGTGVTESTGGTDSTGETDGTSETENTGGTTNTDGTSTTNGTSSSDGTVVDGSAGGSTGEQGGSGNSTDGTATNSGTDGTAGGTTGGGNSTSTGADGSDTTTGGADGAAAGTVNVDKSSINGEGLLMCVTLTGLTADQVTAYTTEGSTEHNNLKINDAKTYDDTVSASTQNENVESLLLKRVVKLSDTSVKAEYLANIRSTFVLSQMQATMATLQETNKAIVLKKVPLTATNRWTSITVRITNEEYSADLADPSTTAFANFKNRFQTKMLSHLKDSVAKVKGVYLMEVTPGSVVARSSVEVDLSATATTTTDIDDALNGVTEVDGLVLDPQGTVVQAEEYISGAQTVNPVVEPSAGDLLGDTEDISRGDVSLAEDEADKIPIKRNNYFLTVTVPSFAAVLLLIIMLLCCTTSNSCLCRICSNDPKAVP